MKLWRRSISKVNFEFEYSSIINLYLETRRRLWAYRGADKIARGTVHVGVAISPRQLWKVLNPGIRLSVKTWRQVSPILRSSVMPRCVPQSLDANTGAAIYLRRRMIPVLGKNQEPDVRKNRLAKLLYPRLVKNEINNCASSPTYYYKFVWLIIQWWYFFSKNN